VVFVAKEQLININEEYERVTNKCCMVKLFCSSDMHVLIIKFIIKINDLEKGSIVEYFCRLWDVDKRGMAEFFQELLSSVIQHVVAGTMFSSCTSLEFTQTYQACQHLIWCGFRFNVNNLLAV